MKRLSVLLLIWIRVGASEYVVESLSFGTMLGISSAGTFSLEGRWDTLATGASTGGDYSLEGSIRPIGVTPRIELTGRNVLPYGDAEGIVPSDEQNVSGLPGWTVEGELMVVRWGTAGGWPLETDSGPPDRGENFFGGGNESGRAVATHTATIPLSADVIDAGKGVARLSGWFGGFLGQADTAFLRVRFLDATGLNIDSMQIGGVTSDMRTNRTGLIPAEMTRAVPTGARHVEVALEIVRSAPLGWNDGYADNLQLVFAESTPTALVVSAALGETGRLELNVASEVGKVYALEAIDDLSVLNWTTASGTEKPGTGGMLHFEIPLVEGVSRGFFRLRVTR